MHDTRHESTHESKDNKVKDMTSWFRTQANNIRIQLLIRKGKMDGN